MEPPCLKYPENLGLHQAVSYETAVNMLLRAIPLSQTTPYTWSFIDKPAEGQLLLIFQRSVGPFPNDGIRYQEQETRYTIPVPPNRELEVMEVKCGFIPSHDNSAWRLRRRYRLHKGGHPQLILVHYTRGPAMPIAASIMNQPVRQYPLRQISDPPVYVMGDKAGQKMFTGGGPSGLPSGPSSISIPPMGMNNMNFNPQQMVAQQNSNMDALERRRESTRAREHAASIPGQRPNPPRFDDDDSADESEMISTRALAMTRYRRNHEFMEEIFKQAAFGNKKADKTTSPFSIFDKTELEEKATKLQNEIEALQANAAMRKAAKSSAEEFVTLDSANASMEIAT